MTRTRRTVRLVISVIGWLALAAAIAVLVPGLFGFERYVIVGGSMEPTIPRGALMYAEIVSVSDLEVGDVVTYVPPPGSGIRHPVTHRISAISNSPDEGRLFVTTGDANRTPDPWGEFTFRETVQPRHRHHLPYVGYVFAALQIRSVRMAAIGGPAAIIALMLLYQIVADVRASRSAPAPRSAPARDLPTPVDD